MDVFQKMYSTYYNVMCFTGLWPDDYTLITKVRRVGFCLLTLCCIGAQVSTLRMVEITLYNLLQTLSFTFPMLLFFLRYVGFVITLPSVKHFLENFGHDYDAVKDPIEADLFMKQAIEARRVVMLLLVISSGGMMLSIFLLLIPTIMQSKLQTRYLNMVGFFYTEVTQDSNVVTLQLIIVICLGLLSITCTESSLAVFVAYLCGLLEIARYRIRTAVDEMACSGTVSSNIINIRSAMDLHRRAVEISADYSKDVTLSYLLAIITVVVSFAINIYRLYLAVGDFKNKENILVCVQITLVHFIIIYLNNYSGQRMISTSIGLFNGIYSSSWYRMPPKSQKILLFVLMRSSMGLQFSLAGLFVPSYEGFSKMVSSSFSYFTMIISV
ncbi:uncharacterized protein LOC143259625 isoform X1 [Megalopta genalis]|uniref:uncharacterized protein LOC143259625 isoform X1 n=1 Tax=Megalopta genalis TaxID=115081 RepID=UPI003FD1D200